MALLALYTCPVLIHPPGAPEHSAFAALDGAVNADLRDAPAPGLVRLFSDLAPPPRWPAHVAATPGTPKPTLSLWRDLEAAFAYSYGPGPHRQALRRRREWFALVTGPVYVLWYVPEGDRVDHEGAAARLERLAVSGPGPAAFDFRHPYDPDGRSLPAPRHDTATRPSAGPVPLPLRERGR